MVVHQAPGVTQPVELAYDMLKYLEKGHAVIVVLEDLLAPVTNSVSYTPAINYTSS
jgi:hypothetical protein